ncbi:aldo/keto reductase [Ferviditalea candida]|uniref:Aldo/keto reductase n=1 Tax=Ferviditalea candida TaxID=3108399 RepID=A0ABU5ZGC1_9BACL|nr:aldo/keto reductase [Paenibacillaceae bacterium T2]
MKKNRLGTSDLFVSEIGLGCMSLGTDAARAVSILHEALDKGIDFFDTSDLYDRGLNEEIIGKAFKGKRQKLILATKAGNRWEEGKSGWTWDPSKSYIKAALKLSLKRLQTDYIDLFQLHGGTLDDPIDETIEAFEELKSEGWIREYGISSIRPNVIREYVNRSNIVSVMSQYSILDRRPEEEILPLLHEHGISLIARGPVAKGILSQRFSEKADQGYQDYQPEELTELVQKLSPLTNETRSLAQLALRFPLSHPAVAAVIPGASSISQLEHNLAAGNLPPLTEDELDLIRRHSKANRYSAHR